MKRRCFFRRGLLSIQDSVGGRKQYFVVRQVRRRRMRFSGSRISFICGLVWCKASSLLCRELVFEEALRSVCPFASVCCSSVGISTSKRNAPSLQAPRAETRLTVYRALRSCFLCRRATLYWHNSGANSLQKCMRFSKNFCTNLEYLVALWSDLDEKLSSWS